MAYNSHNYNKWALQVIKIYKSLKTDDIPDSVIVRREFPKFNIYLSYRQWMNIKGRPMRKEQPTNQLDIFSQVRL
jgi:hypothetical protein